MPITDEQLETAESVCQQIHDKAYEMRMLAITAKDGTFDSLELTPEQKQYLIDRYLAGKTELVQLYNLLP